ncbi:MAG: trypsin-like peptidase domain-containing protein [Planctomycetota bacterium]
MRALGLVICSVCCLCFLSGVSSADDLMPRLRAGLVKLRVNSQGYEQGQPWNRAAPTTSTSRGFVVGPGLILTSANNVRNHILIEVSEANSVRRYPAELKHVDYRAGLALVEITDPELRARMKPLELGDPVKLDDEFDIYQLGSDNMVERANARVVRANASSTRLTLRLQASGLAGGTGEIAVRDGKVVGLVTGTQASKQQATLLSIESIRHYVKDHDDGKYAGLPGGTIWWQPLLRDDLRTYYGLNKDQHGVAITRLGKDQTGHGVLMEGDVLTKIDGYDIDDEGRFTHEVHGRLSARYLLFGVKYAGETAKATVLRKGNPVEVEFKLKAIVPEKRLVPPTPVDTRPEFMIVGGLVIFELNISLAKSMPRSPGGVVIRRYREHATWDPPVDRERVVYVDRVERHPSNKGYETLTHAIIRTVNGKPISRIADVAEALKTPQDKYHVFTFELDEVDFVMHAAETEKINKALAERYNIPRLRYLKGDE